CSSVSMIVAIVPVTPGHARVRSVRNDRARPGRAAGGPPRTRPAGRPGPRPAPGRAPRPAPPSGRCGRVVAVLPLAEVDDLDRPAAAADAARAEPHALEPLAGRVKPPRRDHQQVELGLVAPPCRGAG